MNGAILKNLKLWIFLGGFVAFFIIVVTVMFLYNKFEMNVGYKGIKATVKGEGRSAPSVHSNTTPVAPLTSSPSNTTYGSQSPIITDSKAPVNLEFNSYDNKKH